MRSAFPGYYRPSPKEFEQLWEKALIVPDANVLLTLYRLGDTTRQRLLDILQEFKDRLFLSYQAGYEFQKNRLTVIEEQESVYDTLSDQIDDFPGSVGRELREHPRLDRKDLEARVEKALAPVKNFVKEVHSQHPTPLSGDVIGSDSVRNVLDEIFFEKVGPERDLYGLAEEGARRYDRKQPPGYEDKGKNEPERYGDLAIWLDTIDAAKNAAKDVIFVTADRKEDWWWVRSGKRIGARPELVAEMRERAERSVYLYDVNRFMEEASNVLGLGEISEDEREEVARAQKASVHHVWPKLVDWGSVIPKYIEPHGDIEASNLIVPLSFMETSRWHSSAQVEDNAVVLHLSHKPELFMSSWHTGHQISCVVTGPGGGRSQATIVNTSYSATFTYPNDFLGDTEFEPGSYDYEWHIAGGQEGFALQSGRVASGGFELPDPSGKSG